MPRVWILIIVPLLVSCGLNPNSNNTYTGGGSGPVQFDSSVPADQRTLIQADLGVLSQTNHQSATQEDFQLLGVSDFSAQSLSNWLYERLRVIVGESFDYKTRLVGSDGRPQYVSNIVSAEGDYVTIMDNVGGLVYLTGREQGLLLGLQWDGGTVMMDTPRRGIIRIGKGLFTTITVKNSNLNSLGNSLLRIPIYFHETRHDDGNGENVAFKHVKCTSGALKGRTNCDSSLNGPFGIEAALYKNNYYTCTSCTQSEQQKLMYYLSDALSRIEPNSTYKDPTPENFR